MTRRHRWAERAAERGPRPIRESLAAVTAGFGSRGKAIDLTQRWEAAVGETVAAHAQPERLEAGRLTVVVDDPAWATELRYHSARILAALNSGDHRPAISQMHLRVRAADA